MKVSERESIIKETEQFLIAWNNGDAKAAAAFYSKDGCRVGAFGDMQHNRAEIEKAYEHLMHTC